MFPDVDVKKRDLDEKYCIFHKGITYYKSENTEEQTVISLLGWLSFKKKSWKATYVREIIMIQLLKKHGLCTLTDGKVNM